MNRRHFLQQGGLSLAGLALGPHAFAHLHPFEDQIIGHGDFRYKIDLHWGALHSGYYPVQDCHEMVQDAQGRIILLTNHTRNNVIIYNKAGKLQEVWGTEYPGAHGLTLHQEGQEEFLYIADNSLHQIIKTTLKGQEVMRLDYPKMSGKYEKPDQYIPTETAIADNGDIYVADGYGSQYILHYNAKGELLNTFGGKGAGPEHFGNAHGIAIDQRDPANPCLLITDRMVNQLKRFSLEGKYLSTIELPGAFICRPVIHGEHVYLATIWSGDGSAGTGFISILDKNNQLVSAPGGSAPRYEDDQLRPMYQALKVFHHPHDVCVDEDENLYVAQWNSGQTYPIKLYRV
ncbi:MAG: 6-bladed beta-propeller [Bacteroidota bacterium]